MKNIFRWTTKVIFLFTIFLIGLQTAYAQLYSGLHEFNNSAVPQRVIFKRELERSKYVNNRYIQYAGQPLQKIIRSPFVIGPGSNTNTAKNPENIIQHGPMHAQNITAGYFPGAVWHSLSFRVKTKDFFRPGINGHSRHLAFISRAIFPQQNTDGLRDGMGVILHQDVKYGNTVEIFNTISKKLKPGTTDEYVNSEENPFGKPMCPNRNDGTREYCLPADDQTFFIQIYATKDYMLYYIANESTQQLSGFREMNRTVAGHGGAGLAFGVICDNDNRETYDCEVSPFVIGPGTGPNNDYTVDIYDINSQWF